MSKLGCVCGGVIRDQSDQLPNKAYFLTDRGYSALFDTLEDEIQSFLAAVASGITSEWMRSRGYSGIYTNGSLDQGELLAELIHSQFLVYSRTLYECMSCGRLKLEVSPNSFLSYLPDDNGVNGVFQHVRSDSIIADDNGGS